MSPYKLIYSTQNKRHVSAHTHTWPHYGFLAGYMHLEYMLGYMFFEVLKQDLKFESPRETLLILSFEVIKTLYSFITFYYIILETVYFGRWGCGFKSYMIRQKNYSPILISVPFFLAPEKAK